MFDPVSESKARPQETIKNESTDDAFAEQDEMTKTDTLIKPDGRMSMDNMIAASHLLSMSQNGRAFVLNRYPPIVRKYVERVVEADAVDENLKALNQMIVDRLSEEAGKYEQEAKETAASESK